MIDLVMSVIEEICRNMAMSMYIGTLMGLIITSMLSCLAAYYGIYQIPLLYLASLVGS